MMEVDQVRTIIDLPYYACTMDPLPPAPFILETLGTA